MWMKWSGKVHCKSVCQHYEWNTGCCVKASIKASSLLFKASLCTSLRARNFSVHLCFVQLAEEQIFCFDRSVNFRNN